MKIRFKKIRRLGQRIAQYFTSVELPATPEALPVRLAGFKERVLKAEEALTKRLTGAWTSFSGSRSKLAIKDEILKDHIDPMRTLVRAMAKRRKNPNLKA